MSELLTAEERSALQEPFADSGRATRLVTPAVFANVEQLDPERVAALAAAFRRWLDRVTEDLSGQLRTPCAPRPPRHELVTRGLLPSPEEEPFWASIDGHPGSGLLVTLPRSFAAAIAERIFGAPFELRDDRALTPAETALVRDLVQRWFIASAETWHGEAARLLPCVDADEAEPVLEQQVWLRFESDLLCGSVVGAIGLSLAPFTARVLLGEGMSETAPPPTTASVRSRLGDVRIELRAVLGEATFTLDELSSLRVGDVIALDRSAQDPVDLVVQDRTLFRARAGVAGQWVAIELLGAPKEEKRSEY
jgi:flagellar motor switch/type III secretory pathway protein FliN